ncbi:hypothetical protein B6U91_01500 [Candidatus Pacearchaeota archaeon ex4484_71]|nr:MAG: hypothetical protein B6U91_01500 [Candidatus Pacearchaeota archaeon ex4484_71]
MKGVFIIIDGLGGADNKRFDGKTCLEAANTPNLDFFATRGKLGYMYPVKPAFVPESDEALVSIFGNDLLTSTRGQLEALGAGLSLKRGDLALRVNFATIDSLERGNILDRRVARTLTTNEAQSLSEALNKIKMPCKFEFKPTLHHRGVLVFRGGFSDNITGNDITYSKGRSRDVDKINLCRALDDEENSKYTAKLVNEFLSKAFDVLNTHPVNMKRRESALLPANYLMVRGAGVEKPRLKQYKKWVSFTYSPLEKGFAQACGMKNSSFSYPKLKNLDAYKNLYDGLRKACKSAVKFLKKNHKKAEYAYIHFKEVDSPGHDNKPLEKKEMIEYIDRTFFKFLREFAPPKKIKVLVSADHSTPCKLKGHSASPVPVLLYDFGIPKEKKFNEKEAKKGELGAINGKDLLKKVGFKR